MPLATALSFRRAGRRTGGRRLPAGNRRSRSGIRCALLVPQSRGTDAARHEPLPQLLPMASPPVAAARYLRARAGRHGVHMTYVGDCPGGSDPAIDRHATPSCACSEVWRSAGSSLEDQPTEVDERLLRDGRRFYSLPGGAPAPNWLYVEKRGYTLIEPTASDFLAEVAFRVSKKERRVVDLAPRLGCACRASWSVSRGAKPAKRSPRASRPERYTKCSTTMSHWTSRRAGPVDRIGARGSAHDPDHARRARRTVQS